MPDMNYGAVAEIVREEIQADYVPNACILAARITTLALREFGVSCQAVAAEVDACSPAYTRMYEQAKATGREPSKTDVERFAAEGAWRVSLTLDPAHPGMLDRRDKKGYHLHVVALADDRRWVIDPTLGQVDRPEKGLIIERPYAFELDAEAWDERMLAMMMDNHTVLSYRFLPGRRDFTKAPDWNPRERSRKTTFERALGRVLERMEKEALIESGEPYAPSTN